MEKPDKCLKVHKFLYGQRGAPRSFNEAMSAFLTSIGGKVSLQDECLFIFDLYPEKESEGDIKRKAAAAKLLGDMLNADVSGKSKFKLDDSYSGPSHAFVGGYVDDFKILRT